LQLLAEAARRSKPWRPEWWRPNVRAAPARACCGALLTLQRLKERILLPTIPSFPPPADARGPAPNAQPLLVEGRLLAPD